MCLPSSSLTLDVLCGACLFHISHIYQLCNDLFKSCLAMQPNENMLLCTFCMYETTKYRTLIIYTVAANDGIIAIKLLCMIIII